MEEPDTDKLLAPIESLLAKVSVEQVYGAPHTEGDTTIIPVADVVLGFGYGVGKGTAPSTDTEGAASGAPAPGGSGGGGGAGGRATPRGYIRIDPRGVTYRPIVDEQRLAVCGMMLAGWIVFWMSKTLRAIASR